MSDTLAAPAPDLSPRAQIALLTLQLRSALREADEAELAEQQWDVEAALAQLRSTMHPLVEERRAALEVELADARSEAAARIESVRVVLDAAARRDALRSEEEVPGIAPDPAPVQPIVEEPVIEELVIEEAVIEEAVIEETVIEETVIEEPDEAPGAVLPPPPPPVTVSVWSSPSPDVEPLAAAPLVPPAPWPSPDASDTWRRPSAPGAPLTADDVRAIVSELLAESAARQAAPLPAIDPDAFSRAFASAFGAALGAALDDRLGGPSFGTARYVAPAPKRSFWANMWHADVMMSLLAAVIVLVVLIAWST